VKALILALAALPACALGAALAIPAATPSPSGAEMPARVTSDVFSFQADNVPMKKALALFARANHLTIVPDLDVDGMITVDFQDLPLNLAMGALLDASGYYFVEDGRLLRVRNQETRLFQLDYIRATRTSQGSNAVQISSGSAGSSGSGGSSGGSSGASQGSEMTLTNSSTINFWGELAEQLKTIVSPTGTYTINSLAGTVLIRDNHRSIETVAGYLDAVMVNVVRQVDLEVEIYEVDLNKSNQLGINWQSLANHLSATTIPGQLLLGSGGGFIVQTPVFGAAPGPAALNVNYQQGGLSAILQALQEQGDLKVVSKPRLRTLNNQPAVVRVGQDLPVFTQQVTQSPGNPPVITTSESVQTITVGTVLSITPQVSSDGLITLDITPAVSRLVSTLTSASGNTSAPVIDIRQASSMVRVRDGATVIMGGLVQDSSTTTHRTIPILGNIPGLGKLFGGDYSTKDRTELVFFLTPHVIKDEKSK
jgi:MSHA biogenesis protein MshL